MFRGKATVHNFVKYRNIVTKNNPPSYKVLYSAHTPLTATPSSLHTSSQSRGYSTIGQAQYAPTSGSGSGVTDPGAITYVQSEKAPKAVGPYSQGVKANGNFYVSGCLPINAETGEMVGETTAEQARQALQNLNYVLEAGGCTLHNVVKTTVLLVDISDFQSVNEVYSEFFSGENQPARVCYAVNQLPKGAKVEVEAIAVYKE